MNATKVETAHSAMVVVLAPEVEVMWERCVRNKLALYVVFTHPLDVEMARADQDDPTTYYVQSIDTDGNYQVESRECSDAPTSDGVAEVVAQVVRATHEWLSDCGWAVP